MNRTSIKHILKDVSMFSSLEEDDLLALEKISNIHAYKKGETLFVAGDVSNALMLLVEGVVSVFKHDDKGNEIVISHFEGHELIAEAATLRHTPLPSSARFQQDFKPTAESLR